MLYQKITDADALGNDIRYYNNLGFPHPHMHRSAELLVVERGGVFLTVNGRMEALHAGDAALVLPYQLHSFEIGGEAFFWVHVFEQSCAPMFFTSLGARYAPAAKFRPDADTLAYYRAVCLIRTDGGEGRFGLSEAMGSLSQMKLKSALYAVLADYLAGTEPAERESAEDSLFSQLMAYIAEHCTEDITLASMAAHFGYEPHYLSRYMRRVTDINFRWLVNRCRIDWARHLLDSTGMSITEAALASGYGCMRTFSRVFREMVGCTPGEYRKMSGRS